MDGWRGGRGRGRGEQGNPFHHCRREIAQRDCKASGIRKVSRINMANCGTILMKGRERRNEREERASEDRKGEEYGYLSSASWIIWSACRVCACTACRRALLTFSSRKATTWAWSLAQRARRGFESPLGRIVAAGGWTVAGWCPNDGSFDEWLGESCSLRCRLVGGSFFKIWA